MKSYSFSHLTDPALLQGLAAQLTHHRGSTATLLAYLAEVDERRLHVPAGYPSMYLYCLRELHMSEGTAFKRIRAARTARQFPAIYPALAEGRLHLSAVVMLTPHLSAGHGGRAPRRRGAPEQGRDRAHAGATLPAAGPADMGRGDLATSGRGATGRAARGGLRRLSATDPGASCHN